MPYRRVHTSWSEEKDLYFYLSEHSQILHFLRVLSGKIFGLNVKNIFLNRKINPRIY